jgi:hypothetical protein
MTKTKSLVFKGHTLISTQNLGAGLNRRYRRAGKITSSESLEPRLSEATMEVSTNVRVDQFYR